MTSVDTQQKQDMIRITSLLKVNEKVALYVFELNNRQCHYIGTVTNKMNRSKSSLIVKIPGIGRVTLSGCLMHDGDYVPRFAYANIDRINQRIIELDTSKTLRFQRHEAANTA